MARLRVRTRRGFGSRPTWRRETTSCIDNHVAVRMRDGVNLYADVYRPVGDGRYPVLVSKTPYSTERFPTAYDAAVLLRAARLRLRLRGRQGASRVRWRLGAVPQQRTGQLRHHRVGRQATLVRRQGRHAGWLATSGRTSGARRRRHRRASSPSFRWWPRPASITTGSRSTADGGCRSTLAGDRCGRNHASCRIPARTRSTGSKRFTMTRSRNTCR